MANTETHDESTTLNHRGADGTSTTELGASISDLLGDADE